MRLSCREAMGGEILAERGYDFGQECVCERQPVAAVPSRLIGMLARSPDRAGAHVAIIDKPASLLGIDTPAAGERSYPRPRAIAIPSWAMVFDGTPGSRSRCAGGSLFLESVMIEWEDLSSHSFLSH